MPTVWELIGDFLSNIFNLDSKFFKTARDIFVPAKLTKKFIEGVRGQYYQPFRLLFVMSFLFFAILSLTDFSAGLEDSSVGKEYKKFVKKTTAIAIIDSTQEKVIAKTPPPQKALAKRTLDTLKHTIIKQDNDSTSIILIRRKRWRFALKDIAQLSSDEIIKKYNIENYWDRLILKKGLKTLKNPDKFITYLIGNIIWLLALLLPVLSLIMKLLYIRRKRYYIEHFVFLLHQHAFLFLWGIFLLIIFYNFEITDTRYIFWVWLTPLIYILASMKRYYGQNIIKTFLKFILLSLSYFFWGLVIFVLVTIVSFALF